MTLKTDPQQLGACIEESSRLRASTQGLSAQFTSHKEEFWGLIIPKSSALHLRWAAENIDTGPLGCPIDLHLDHRAASRHLHFAARPRECPGASMSLLEQQIAWTRVVE